MFAWGDGVRSERRCVIHCARRLGTSRGSAHRRRPFSVRHRPSRHGVNSHKRLGVDVKHRSQAHPLVKTPTQDLVPAQPSFHRALNDPSILTLLTNAARDLGYALN